MRILTYKEQKARGPAWVFLFLILLPLAWGLSGTNEIIANFERLGTTPIVVWVTWNAGCLLVFLASAYRLRSPKSWFEIDEGARVVRYYEDRAETASVPFDQVGPLQFYTGRDQYSHKGRSYSRTVYGARSEAFSEGLCRSRIKDKTLRETKALSTLLGVEFREQEIEQD